MYRLPFSIGPKYDESLLSFLVRAAEENFLEADHIGKIVGLKGGQILQLLFSDYDATLLSEVLGCDRHHIDYRRYLPHGAGQHSFFGLPIVRDLFGNATRRWGPVALQEDAYHRAHWDLTFIFTDQKTGEILQSTCPRCRSEQSWKCKTLVTCFRCGFDLREAERDEMPTAFAALDKFLHGLISPFPDARTAARSRISLPLREASISTLVELLFLMGSAAIRNDPAEAYDTHGLLPGRFSELRAGYRLLTDWPAAPRKLLEQEWSSLSSDRFGAARRYSAAGRLTYRARSAEARRLLLELTLPLVMNAA